ncbi:oligopeptide transporter [Colletotrichum tofieldiae]|nr:oligopeptide transporter [Colletotrichum tofieldiae]
MVLIAVGVAGVKATLPPFLGTVTAIISWSASEHYDHSTNCVSVDQYNRSEEIIFKVKGSKALVANRALTIQFITNMFFWLTNLAALSSLASTWIEKEVDFWASYLMGFTSLFVTVVLIYFWKSKLGEHPFI